MSDSNDLSYSSYLKTSQDSNWRGYRPYYRDNNTGSIYPTYEDNRIKDLIYQLEMKSQENFNIKMRLEETEKIKENLMIQLEDTEREYERAAQIFTERENELLDNIRFLELDKNNIEEKYRLNLRVSESGSFGLNNLNDDEELLLRENRRIKETNLKNEITIEMLTHFYNKLQNIILRNPSKLKNFVLLENLDRTLMRTRLNQMLEEIERLSEERYGRGIVVDDRVGEGVRSLVMTNSEIVNKKLTELSEENEVLRKRIESLNFNYNSNYEDFINNKYPMNNIESLRSLNSDLEENKIKKNYEYTPQNREKTPENAKKLYSNETNPRTTPTQSRKGVEGEEMSKIKISASAKNDNISQKSSKLGQERNVEQQTPSRKKTEISQSQKNQKEPINTNSSEILEVVNKLKGRVDNLEASLRKGTEKSTTEQKTDNSAKNQTNQQAKISKPIAKK